MTLHAGRVVHFDLKLQNVYLSPHPNTEVTEFWLPSSSEPPFTLVVGDFGQSQMFDDGSEGYTVQSLGTDFMKSPEMLQNGQHPMLHRQRNNFDRRKHKGAGQPSDVWSLACILYELVFGEMLFFDQDYMRFLQRVSCDCGPVIPEKALANLSQVPAIAQLVELMTQRNQEARIDLLKVQAKLRQMLESSCDTVGPFNTQLPVYTKLLHYSGHKLPEPAAVVPEWKAGSGLLQTCELHESFVPCENDQCRVPASPFCKGPHVVRLSWDLYICPVWPCFDVSSIVHLRVKTLVIIEAVVGARVLPRHSVWLQLASDAGARCVFVKTNDLTVPALLHFCQEMCSDRTLVFFDAEAWRSAALLSLSLLIFRGIPPVVGVIRLHQCLAYGRLCRQDLVLLKLFSDHCSVKGKSSQVL